MKKIEFKSVEDFKGAEYNAYLIDVTPTMAAAMLKESIGNRKINQANLKGLVIDMQRDEYYYNTPGSGISFNKNGKLVNGHHTLTAIRECGKTQTLTILLGTDHIERTDIGKSRSIKDSLAMSGLADKYQLITEISPIAVNILRDKYNIQKTNAGYKKEFSRTEVEEFCVEKYDELVNLIEEYKIKKKEVDCRIKGYPKFEKGYFCSLIYLMCEKYDEKLVKDFMYGIMSSNTQKYRSLDNFRKQVQDNSRKIAKKTAWTFADFEEKINNAFKKYLKEIALELVVA